MKKNIIGPKLLQILRNCNRVQRMDVFTYKLSLNSHFMRAFLDIRVAKITLHVFPIGFPSQKRARPNFLSQLKMEKSAPIYKGFL